jgi:hypothetical protein
MAGLGETLDHIKRPEIRFDEDALPAGEQRGD